MLNYQEKNTTENQDAAYYVTRLLFGALEVIIPQAEIASIESIGLLNPDIKNKRHIGQIHKQKTIIPVYCFSDEMEFLQHAPEDRSKCVVIKHRDGDFSILCHDVKNDVFSDMRLQTVPACMRNHIMPLSHLCLYKEAGNLLKLGLVSNAEYLNSYIKNTNVPIQS